MREFLRQRVPMSSDPGFTSSVSDRLRCVTNELNEIEEILISDHLDSSVLTDFRDAVNRVRTTAWAVAQYLESGAKGEQSSAVLNSLAHERVRVTYRLCRLIEADLSNGQMNSSALVQLYLASQDLAHRLCEVLGRDEQPTSAQAARRSL
jgi:hypothetical protein